MLKHFAGRDAVVVLFAWPTAENFLRYARDIRNALGSAPQLADLVRLLAARTQAAKIDVFTYSAGATVGSDALALLARESPDVAAPPRRDLPRRARRRLPRLRRRPRRLRPARPPRHRRRQPRRQRAPPRRRPSTAPPAPAAPTSRELSPDASARLLAAAADGEIEIVQVHPDRMPELVRHLAHLLVRPPLGLQRRPAHPPLPPPPARAAASTPAPPPPAPPTGPFPRTTPPACPPSSTPSVPPPPLPGRLARRSTAAPRASTPVTHCGGASWHDAGHVTKRRSASMPGKTDP